MDNILAWKELAKETYGSINEAVRRLNNVLGLKLTSTCINEMAKGRKNIPVPLVNYINRTLILKKIKEENYKFTETDLEEFLESISLPKRIK